MAKPSKLAHVVYMTRRYQEMLEWYQAVFEAKVQYQNPAFAFLTYDDEHHRFAFANMSVLNPDGTETEATAKLGVNHVGYTFANAGEIAGELRPAEAGRNYALLERPPRRHAVNVLPRSRRQPDGISG